MIADSTTAPLDTLWEAGGPVLFNAWKHHAGWLRQQIARTAANPGIEGLQALASELVVVGTELMDLYLGPLSPAEIGRCVLAELDARGTGEESAFASWVEAGGGYQVVELPDGCKWVLRRGVETDRYIHIHPGRHSPQTRRVRANVLKTAVMALAHTLQVGGDPLDRTVLNLVRPRYLQLAVIGKNPRGDEGVGAVIEALRGSHCTPHDS